MPTDWIKHYGLREDPFGEIGSEGPFFVTPELNQRVNLLLHLVQYSDLLLVVTGSHGSGKTTLIHRLLGDAGPRWRACMLEGDAEMDPGTLLSRIVEGFDLPERSTDAGDPLGVLEAYLQGLRRGATRPVLIVDEAHLLPAASLDQLSRLAADRERLGLALVLFGVPQLLERIGRSVGSGLLHVIDIPALTEEQVSEYLELRLGRAGLRGRNPLNEDAIHVLYKTSRGMPGLVGQAAAQFLANRAEAGGQGLLGLLHAAGQLLLRYRVVAAATAGLLVLIGLAGASLWFLGGGDSPPPTTTIQLRQPQVSAPEAPSGRAREARPLLIPPRSATYPPVSPEASAGRPPPVPATPMARAPEPPRPVASEPVEPTRSSPPPEPVAKAPSTPPAREPAPSEPPRPPAPRPEAAAQESFRGDEGWLLGQAPGNFTVQLFGSHDRQAAERFKETHRLKDRLATYRTNRDGKDWYVVVVGSYGTRDAAQRAIQNLPPEVKRNNPWPRSVASVQDSIRQAPRRD
jgi:DamX protein